VTAKTSNFRIDVADAAALVRQHMPKYGSKHVELEAAQGAILRQQVTAERDQPPFDRVTMDGIAISFSAIESGERTLTVRGTQAAGAAAMEIREPSNCIEIMTGAVLPVDADTVIPVERIRRDADRVTIEADYAPVAGQFIHRKGSDHPAGRPLLEPGIILGAPEMAVLTIAGEKTVEVARWPSIAVISTGDELVDLGGPIEPYQIRSSNDRAIQAALKKRGCRSSHRSRLPDDAKQLAVEIQKLHEQHEILILSGGVSMGKYDYIPQILTELGVDLVFHKILQRPGLPMWFGVSGAGKPVFALPGNPVSSLVCLVRYVAPAILTAMGESVTPQPRMQLSEPVQFEPDLTCFMPVKLAFNSEGELHAVPRPTNTSGDFVSLAGTDGIVELERGRADFPQAYAAPFFPW
jgi:molybdopterin molybdotransferase